MTCPVGRVKNFVVEHREVESKAQADRMGRLHFSLGYVKSLLIAFLRTLHSSLRGKINNENNIKILIFNNPGK